MILKFLIVNTWFGLVNERIYRDIINTKGSYTVGCFILGNPNLLPQLKVFQIATNFLESKDSFRDCYCDEADVLQS